MNTKQAFYRMAEKFNMKNDLVNIAAIDDACKNMVMDWFSNAVLMANTARHNAFAELAIAQITGNSTEWTVDTVCAVEITEDEIDAIHSNFIEIMKNVLNIA